MLQNCKKRGKRPRPFNSFNYHSSIPPNHRTPLITVSILTVIGISNRSIVNCRTCAWGNINAPGAAVGKAAVAYGNFARTYGITGYITLIGKPSHALQSPKIAFHPHTFIINRRTTIYCLLFLSIYLSVPAVFFIVSALVSSGFFITCQFR
jgi:hypothetical protein